MPHISHISVAKRLRCGGMPYLLTSNGTFFSPSDLPAERVISCASVFFFFSGPTSYSAISESVGLIFTQFFGNGRCMGELH